MEVCQTPIVMMDQAGVIHSWNKSAENLFGWTASEAIGSSVFILMPQWLAVRHQSFVDSYIRTGETNIIGKGRELIAIAKNGRSIPIFLTVTSYMREGNTWFVANIVDLGEIQEAIKAADNLNSQYDALFESESLGRVIVTSCDWRIVRANKTVSSILNVVLADLVGLPASQLFLADDADFTEIKQKLVEQRHASTTWKSYTGSEDLEMRASFIPGNSEHILLEITDVTAREQAKRKLEYMVDHDLETGLLTRAGLTKALANELGHYNELTVVLLRVGNFGRIALSHGIKVAIETVNVIIQRFRLFTRATDFPIGRIRENEVTFVLPQTISSYDTIEIISTLSAPINIGAYRIFPHIHIGAVISETIYAMRQVDAPKVLRLALSAIEQSHQKSGPSFNFYDASFDDQIRAQTRMIGSLSSAQQNNELELHYQPIFDARTEQPVSFEALMRWKNPELGNVSPGIFIPLAESGGLISSLGMWAIKTAAEDFEKYNGERRYMVAVNVSALQLEDRNFPMKIRELVYQAGVLPRDIELEITETAVFNSGGQAKDTIRDLQDIGFKISLDDFGSGYSSLGELMEINFDVVKIDMDLLNKAVSNEHHFNLCKSIIDFSHSLGSKIVCEGVSSETHKETAKRLGSDFLQGFLLGKPLPAEIYQQQYS